MFVLVVVVVPAEVTKLSSMIQPSGRCKENVISTRTPVNDIDSIVVTTVVEDDDGADDIVEVVVVSSIF